MFLNSIWQVGVLEYGRIVSDLSTVKMFEPTLKDRHASVFIYRSKWRGREAILTQRPSEAVVKSYQTGSLPVLPLAFSLVWGALCKIVPG